MTSTERTGRITVRVALIEAGRGGSIVTISSVAGLKALPGRATTARPSTASSG